MHLEPHTPRRDGSDRPAMPADCTCTAFPGILVPCRPCRPCRRGLEGLHTRLAKATGMPTADAADAAAGRTLAWLASQRGCVPSRLVIFSLCSSLCALLPVLPAPAVASRCAGLQAGRKAWRCKLGVDPLGAVVGCRLYCRATQVNSDCPQNSTFGKLPRLGKQTPVESWGR